MSRHHLTWICSFLFLPWGLIRRGIWGFILILTRSRGGPGHGTLRWTRTSKQAGKALRSPGHHHAVSCDKAFQDPCHSETREQKYVQQHIRICTHGVKTGLG